MMRQKLTNKKLMKRQKNAVGVEVEVLVRLEEGKLNLLYIFVNIIGWYWYCTSCVILFCWGIFNFMFWQ